MTPEDIKDKYEQRILVLLTKIAETLREAGYTVDEPIDLSCDQYCWSLLVHGDGNGDEDTIDISFRICESEQYDGEEGGVNFMLDIVEWGGRILGGLTPFNYTSQCWVDRSDQEEVEERFAIFEQADPADIVPILERV
jgi:hypothetical protein